MKLDEALVRDGASIIGNYANVLQKTLIHFMCKCGKNHSKTVKLICYGSGAYCESCVSKNTAIKRIKNKIAEQKRLLSLITSLPL